MSKAFNTAWIFLKNYVPQLHLEMGEKQRDEARQLGPHERRNYRMVGRTMVPDVGQFRDERSDNPPTLPAQLGDYGHGGLKMPQEGMSEEEYNKLRSNPASRTPMYDPETLDNYRRPTPY